MITQHNTPRNGGIDSFRETYMAGRLLKPRSNKPVRTVGTYPRDACPLLRYRNCWCRGLCAPREGIGECGRPAPHAMMGRTQKAIAQRLAMKQDRAASPG